MEPWHLQALLPSGWAPFRYSFPGGAYLFLVVYFIAFPLVTAVPSGWLVARLHRPCHGSIVLAYLGCFALCGLLWWSVAFGYLVSQPPLVHAQVDVNETRVLLVRH